MRETTTPAGRLGASAVAPSAVRGSVAPSAVRGSVVVVILVT